MLSTVRQHIRAGMRVTADAPGKYLTFKTGYHVDVSNGHMVRLSLFPYCLQGIRVHYIRARHDACTALLHLKGTVLSRAKRIRLLPVRLLLTSTDFYRCDTSTQSLAIFWYRSIYTWCPLFPTIHYAPSFVTFNTLRVLLPMNVYLPSIIFRV